MPFGEPDGHRDMSLPMGQHAILRTASSQIHMGHKWTTRILGIHDHGHGHGDPGTSPQIHSMDESIVPPGTGRIPKDASTGTTEPIPVSYQPRRVWSAPPGLQEAQR